MQESTHVLRRTLLVIGVAAAAVGAVIVVRHMHSGASPSSAAVLPTVRVTRADLVVSVGGVGRVVEKNG